MRALSEDLARVRASNETLKGAIRAAIAGREQQPPAQQHVQMQQQQHVQHMQQMQLQPGAPQDIGAAASPARADALPPEGARPAVPGPPQDSCAPGFLSSAPETLLPPAPAPAPALSPRRPNSSTRGPSRPGSASCPVSTGGGTRRVQLVREGGWGGGYLAHGPRTAVPTALPPRGQQWPLGHTAS